jgi:Predicted acyltransferases
MKSEKLVKNKARKRTNYIDNLRWMTILLLFPFHAAQLWNVEGFYVWVHTNKVLYIFSTFVYPWLMTLLFLLAGISTKFSLKNRTYKKYLAERCQKLLIPFVFGTLVLSPIMTYIAEIYFNDYTGSYWRQYIMFFTKETDLSGYTGGFTPAHFWFLLYLFIISILFLIVLRLKTWFFKEKTLPTLNYFHLLLLFVPIWLALYIFNIAGKSLGHFFMVFVLGYAVFSQPKAIELLKKNRMITILLWLISEVIFIYLYCILEIDGPLSTGLFVMVGYFGALALLSIGAKYFDFKNNVSSYFTKASFSIYLIHQVWVVVVGFFCLQYMQGILFQFLIITIVSFFLTLLSYTIIKNIPVINRLFGMK